MGKLNIIYKNIRDLHPYKKNAKKHNKEQVEWIANSIKEFGFTQPVVVDKDNNVVAGHGRILGAKKAGLKEVPTVSLDDLTEEQIKAYRLIDNKLNESEWDYNLLDDELSVLENDIDMSLFGFDLTEDEDEDDTVIFNVNGIGSGTLVNDFIVPPFSIIDCNKDIMINRKEKWLNMYDFNVAGVRINITTFTSKSSKNTATVSLFNPVLAEILYRWFNIDSGIVYDCFAGGSVRGMVAGTLGYKYVGIDLSESQIQENSEVYFKNKSKVKVKPKWICDDSRNVDKYLKDNTVDMVFSCPPYFNLEVYSNNVNDISNMELDDFKIAYKDIITKSVSKLKENRFAVFVVGDVRDKNGYYINLIDYTKKCFIDAGMKTYNEIILYDRLGNAPVRARQPFERNRTITKVHQNILVFYKGKRNEIGKNYKEVHTEI